MALGRLWAGRIYGTNTGNLFVKLQGTDEALTGTVHVNEANAALYVYEVAGTFDGSRLKLAGKPQKEIEGLVLGSLVATAKLNERGNLEGEWQTDLGSAGTFLLLPHDRPTEPVATEDGTPEQLYIARHNFGAVGIDREQFTAIADDVQRDLPRSRVIVTVLAGTEQSYYLPEFKKLTFHNDTAQFIKVVGQEPERNGINRVVSIEFGQAFNQAMTQGVDEAWVIGKLEKLKRDLQRYERTYTTNFKRIGIGINQLLLVATIVFLPSLATLRDRAILMGGVLVLIVGVNWLHNRYLPYSAIYLSRKPISFIARVGPSLVSWIIAATAGAAAVVLAAYLQGWLQLGPAVTP